VIGVSCGRRGLVFVEHSVISLIIFMVLVSIINFINHNPRE
jgi:hypothetical protein